MASEHFEVAKNQHLSMCSFVKPDVAVHLTQFKKRKLGIPNANWANRVPYDPTLKVGQ